MQASSAWASSSGITKTKGKADTGWETQCSFHMITLQIKIFLSMTRRDRTCRRRLNICRPKKKERKRRWVQNSRPDSMMTSFFRQRHDDVRSHQKQWGEQRDRHTNFSVFDGFKGGSRVVWGDDMWNISDSIEVNITKGRNTLRVHESRVENIQFSKGQQKGKERIFLVILLSFSKTGPFYKVFLFD
jgi:hypothetical protein